MNGDLYVRDRTEEQELEERRYLRKRLQPGKAIIVKSYVGSLVGGEYGGGTRTAQYSVEWVNPISGSKTDGGRMKTLARRIVTKALAMELAAEKGLVRVVSSPDGDIYDTPLMDFRKANMGRILFD